VAETTAFDHRDGGTDESVWQAANVVTCETPSSLDLSEFDRLVVLAAHPDDETLMCGGLIAMAAAQGMPVDVIVATDGEASHPDSPTHSPDDLAILRRRECTSAVTGLAPQAHLRFLCLPDGETSQNTEPMTTATVETVGDGSGCLLVSTWRGDRHPDHRAAALAASAAAWRTDATHMETPLWFWHWASPSDLPLLSRDGRLFTLALDRSARSAKQSAITTHESQVKPLGPEPGNEALLHHGVLTHFSRATETFVLTEPDRRSPLDDLHRRSHDPWSTRTRWYETRKRALTTAALPLSRTGTILEIGCSVGTLAADLADRCDRVVAVDESAAALAEARRTIQDPRVDLRQCRVPEQWPSDPDSADGELHPDVVVLSEAGYFLSPGRMLALARRIRASGAPVVLACHWRHPVVGWPLDAAAVHAALAGTLELPESLRIEDPDFEVIMWSTPTDGEDD
jgi:LmbE family N-acetylglucosaminyl deacetylase/SAM-dependent methyltransferase